MIFGGMDVRHTFEGGLDKDSILEAIPPNRLRDCKDGELFGEGEYKGLKPLTSLTDVETLIDVSLIPETSVVHLGTYEVLNTSNQRCLIIFTYDNENAGQIHLYNIATTTLTTVSATLPSSGNVAASYYEGYLYFDDGTNALRKFQITTPISVQEVRPTIKGSGFNSTIIGTDGNLLAGTYQIAYQYRNGVPSAFTRPLAIGAGKVGEATNGSITIGIADDTSEDFRLIVIENTDGSVNQTTCKVTPYGRNFTYRGTERTIIKTLDEITVEDLPVLAAKTQVVKDGRLFRGNLTLQNFPSNTVTVTDGTIITAQNSTRRGYFRDEVYAFAIVCHDKYGNYGKPIPIDASSFTGNAGSNWAFKFPDRRTQPIMQSSNPTTLGVRFEGISNFPSWATGFQIVRQKRKKNILYQSPLVQGIVVKGANTSGMDEDDYDEDLTTYMPKVLTLGAAKSLRKFTTAANDIKGVEWYSDPTSYYHIIYPPSYLANYNGNAFNAPSEATGGELCIVDAVHLKKNIVTNGQFEFQNFYYNGASETPINVTHQIGWMQDYVQDSASFKLDAPAYLFVGTERAKTFGGATDLITKQFEHASVPTASINKYFKAVQLQRGILVNTELPITDFCYTFAYDYNNGGTQYFPTITPPANIYDTTSLNTTVDAQSLGVAEATQRGLADHHALYIVNICNGLSDNRYNQDDEYIGTGIYQKITNPVTDSFDINVWGGDCTISKAHIRINQNTPTIVTYDPDDAETDTPQTQGYKTGAFSTYEERISVYIESEVDFTKITTSFIQGFDYEYNFGYSKQMTDKVFQNRETTTPQENLICWSDVNVFSLGQSEFEDEEGFNRYKVNNIHILDKQFGTLTRLIELGNKAIYAIQRDRVKYLPVGVDEITQANNNTLAVGTGQVLGSGDRYLQLDSGTTAYNTIRVIDGRGYYYDDTRKIVVVFGGGSKVISDIGMDTHFKNNIPSWSGYYDERYILGGQIFNTKFGVWEGEFSNTDLLGIEEDYYITKPSLDILKLQKRSTTNLTMEFQIVINAEPQLTKVIQVLRTSRAITNFTVQAYKNGTGLGATNNLTMRERNNEYAQNLIRDTNNKKIRGTVFIVTIRTDKTIDYVLSRLRQSK